MRKVFGILAAFMLALTVGIIGASQASAGSGDPDVKDFYYARSCTPSGTSYKFNLTNYDLHPTSTNTDQQYHYSMTGGTPYAVEFWISGNLIAEDNTYLNDSYKGFGNYYQIYRVEAVWKTANGNYYSCYINR